MTFGRGDRRVRVLVLAAALTLLTAGCDWPQFGFGPEHTGASPDRSISAGTVGGLHLDWVGPTGSPLSSPAVAGGVTYVEAAPASNQSALFAFDAKGSGVCTGIPRVCAPLWRTRATGGASITAPAVAGGFVLTAHSDGVLRAYDAAGVTNCAGAPKVCDPIWSGSSDLTDSTSITVAGGKVFQGYFGSVATVRSGVAVYDLSGTTNCAGVPKVCAPLFRADVFRGAFFAPTVSGGRLFVSDDIKLYAFDAAGVTNCTGAPRVCEPLWSADIAGAPGSVVAAGGGRLFLSARSLTVLYAFDAAGRSNCSGIPTTCHPLFTADANGTPALSGGRVYAQTALNTEAAFDANGVTNCSPTHHCAPLWRYDLPPIQCTPPGPCGSHAPAAIANDLLYVATTDAGPISGTLSVYDATGKSCTSTPKTCAALVNLATGGSRPSSPVVSDGLVYLGSNRDGRLEAYAPVAGGGVRWTQRTPATSPPAREEEVLVADTASHTVVLFGGFNTASADFGDTWTWNGTTWRMRNPTTSPPARKDAAGATDPTTGHVVMFGGSNGSGYLADTWVWDGRTWAQQHPATSPPARGEAVMAADLSSGKVVLFGGRTVDAYLGDTWLWDGRTWTQQHPATSPSPRVSTVLAGDIANRTTVLFGGLDVVGIKADTWNWNGTTWIEQHPTTHPGTRVGEAMATERTTGNVVLFGGNSTSAFLNDTWTWNGTAWMQEHPPTSPSPRVSSMATDPHGGVVLFGGVSGGGRSSDTWSLNVG